MAPEHGTEKRSPGNSEMCCKAAFSSRRMLIAWYMKLSVFWEKSLMLFGFSECSGYGSNPRQRGGTGQEAKAHDSLPGGGTACST